MNESDEAPTARFVALCTVLTRCLERENAAAPKEIFDCVCMLHGTTASSDSDSDFPHIVDALFALGDAYPFGKSVREAQDSVLALCELWILQDRDQWQRVSPHVLLYLLVAATQPDAQPADVKRLYPVRRALDLIAFDQRNANALIALLQRAFASRLFLACEKGKKFLLFVLSLHATLLEPVHIAISSALPFAEKREVEVYAELYFQVPLDSIDEEEWLDFLLD